MKTPTIQQVIDQYLGLTGEEVGARRDEERRRVLGLFAQEHGEQPADEAKPIQLLAWLKGRSEWRSNWTRKSALGIIHRAFNWATRMGLLVRNPLVGVSLPRGVPQRPMTGKEFKRLYRAADRRFRAVLAFLRLTGCRPGELSSMTWGSVDWEKAAVTLHNHKTAKKTGKPRVIYLPPKALELLTRMKGAKRRRRASMVFMNRAGRAWTRGSLSLRMQRLRRRADLPKDCRLYGLRHGFGVQAIKNGVNLKTLSLLMGHASVTMTEHYLTYLSNETATLQAAAAQAVSRGPAVVVEQPA